MKEDVSKHLPAPIQEPWPEAIVRDVARMDAYPEPDDSPWGISPWFKVEIKELYHRGLEMLLKFEEVVFERQHDGQPARDHRGQHGPPVQLLT